MLAERAQTQDAAAFAGRLRASSQPRNRRRMESDSFRYATGATLPRLPPRAALRAAGRYRARLALRAALEPTAQPTRLLSRCLLSASAAADPGRRFGAGDPRQRFNLEFVQHARWPVNRISQPWGGQLRELRVRSALRRDQRRLIDAQAASPTI